VLFRSTYDYLQYQDHLLLRDYFIAEMLFIIVNNLTIIGRDALEIFFFVSKCLLQNKPMFLSFTTFEHICNSGQKRTESLTFPIWLRFIHSSLLYTFCIYYLIYVMKIYKILLCFCPLN